MGSEEVMPASCEDTLGSLTHPRVSAPGSSHARVVRKHRHFLRQLRPQFGNSGRLGLVVALLPTSWSESLGLQVHFIKNFSLFS